VFEGYLPQENWVSCYTGAIVGGNYNNGLSDGAFALNANNALSNANANIGASIS